MVSNTPLTYFRVAFGLLLALYGMWSFRENIAYYDTRRIHLGFEPLRFLRAPTRMWAVFVAEIVAACAFAAGLPGAAPVLFALRLFVFLLDSSKYQNHLYLILLLLGLYCVVDANTPRLVPAWQVGVVRFQVCVVYFWGGLRKLNPDWLVRGQPFRAHLPGPLKPYARWLCWAGALFDLTVPFALWCGWLPAIVPFVAFHAFNQWLYGLGIFPLLNHASLLLFYVGEPVNDVPWVYVVAQLLIPLARAEYFSWDMKLHDMRMVKFSLTLFDRRSGKTLQTISPRAYCSDQSVSHIQAFPRRLAMFLERLEPIIQQGYGDRAGVRCVCWRSDNNNPPAQLIDPTADLRGTPVRWFRRYPWQRPGS